MRPATLLLLAVCAACATDAPGGVSAAFDDGGDVIEVVALGDGFVRFSGERVPLEALVLTLRQRTRAMSKEERARLAVQLKFGPHSDDPAIKARMAADLDRLLGQLQIMGVGHARYL